MSTLLSGGLHVSVIFNCELGWVSINDPMITKLLNIKHVTYHKIHHWL